MSESLENFFDRYDLFFETSSVGTKEPQRLKNRYLGIVDRNRNLFEGASVLDIGSHDGRWSLAALDAGARYVTGIEGRQKTLETARATFKTLDVNPDSYNFVLADATQEIGLGSYDLILCLGFMYHTPRHWELFSRFDSVGAQHVIIDTKVMADQRRPITGYMEEPTTDHPGCAIPESRGELAIVGVPSCALIRFLAEHFGFSVSEIDWHNIGITDWRGCEDYQNGSRRTYILARLDKT